MAPHRAGKQRASARMPVMRSGAFLGPFEHAWTKGWAAGQTRTANFTPGRAGVPAWLRSNFLRKSSAPQGGASIRPVTT